MMNATTNQGDKTMNNYVSLERAFEEVLGIAQVDDRGIDQQAGIVFAYAMLSGTFSHSLVPSNVSNRYHTLLKSQQRYVARLIREGSSYAEDAKSADSIIMGMSEEWFNLIID